MKILLDTQCWLWWISAPEKLNRQVSRRIADKRNTVYLSAASSWEIAIKYSIGKLPLPEPPMRFIPKRLARDAIAALPVEVIHTLYVADLPLHHKDPFDRILISQSIQRGIPIVTADRQFERYDVKIIPAGA
ncbi:MAG: type II toxin-antitoxin system VapC family toxin [Desulfobacterales bacterium]